MKVVIFAGGLGSRISEESTLKPKPMIEIGGKPILWHIMKIYQAHGFNEFIICLGYMGYIIKEYFTNYFIHNSDLTIDLNSNKLEIHKSKSENFKITLVDTGINTMTAGRLKRVEKYIGKEDFMLTYGDGVADINIKELIAFHKLHKKIATVTTVQPGGKFGILTPDENGIIKSFEEKPKNSGSWINAGFFVLKPSVFKYLDENSDKVMWEQLPMKKLVKDKQLAAYKHNGFWRCMDILRDKVELEEMWKRNPKWKIWD